MAEPSAELVARAQAGQQEALVALVQSQQSFLYGICVQVMRNPEDAADMTQEAVIKLLRALPTYRAEDGARFTTWAYRLATNVCLDGLRRRRARPAESLDAVALWASDEDGPALGDSLADESRWDRPEAVVLAGEEARQVRAALARLPAAQRTALALLYFDERRYEEIAEIMGLPLNTVKSHIRRGKERLAVLLADENPVPASLVERSPSGASSM